MQQTYNVIPLSPKLGLIEWFVGQHMTGWSSKWSRVTNCDTLHQLVKDHREKSRIQLNLEIKYMSAMSTNYDNLTLVQVC